MTFDRSCRPAGLAAAAVLAFAASTASAEEDVRFMITTTSDLAGLCAETPESLNYAAAIHMCHGYIVGVHQLHTAAIAASETGGIYCVPDPAPSRNQVVSDFVGWVAANEDAAAVPAVEGLMRFAAQAYPCN
ncbi:hypothetical protein LNKW23_07550 [Paralimibaculum aggregatum]|uniref:Rap1a immunity protein domain-containing protein n=1 Tax=Paralimibaculum aggregatum TaxID=3036245 RepID=A0ABQ6LDW4_9RHOB|nr:Rap1a/Tai family immunity protein [Limibaculum sp. NKW23]GMG81542.1 hypothetical protein LNKW23_07550 [Limibaculum sp. NKW23]